ncbi:MAG: EamA family transporter [SAR324 cluster bacterium]|uniref:EamA family transporter n=1 Tax=SAR324 cluster bacterium TaxID=2024889 RepID=A0A2A4T3C2_9DELT|nr:MAG: EamA family transporter [SAR324 cluster bacterium]
MSRDSKSMLLGLFAVICFGLTLPITKFVIGHMNPIFIGLGRACLAALVAAILLAIFRVPLPSKDQFKKLIIVVLGVVIGFPIFTALAMNYVPASHGGVVIGLLPLVTAIIAAIISKERPSYGFWIMGLVGSSLVIVFTLLEGGGSFHIADLALLGAVISAGFGYAVGAKLAKEMPGWQVICWSLVIAFPFILIPAWINRPPEVLSLPASVWAGFIYLSLVSQLFGFFFWYKALAMGGVARVSQVQLNQTFVTLFAATLFLGEPLKINTILFAILIVAVVAIGKKMPIQQNLTKSNCAGSEQ